MSTPEPTTTVLTASHANQIASGDLIVMNGSSYEVVHIRNGATIALRKLRWWELLLQDIRGFKCRIMIKFYRLYDRFSS